MKPFVLAAVLKLREQAERAEERVALAAFCEVQNARAASDAFSKVMREYSIARAARLDQVSIAAHHSAAALDWKAMLEHKQELDRHVHELERRARLQRDRFLEARKNREVLTELSEKYEKARTEILNRSERRILEDVFLSRLIGKR